MSAASPARPSGLTRSSTSEGSRCWLDERRRTRELRTRERRQPVRDDAAVHGVRSRRGETVFRRADARRVSRSAAVVRRALPSGISIDRAGLAASRDSRRSRAAGGGSPAHSRRLRGPGEPRRSPARQPALCAVRGRRPRRSAADHGVVARRFRNRHVPGAQLSSAHRRPVAVGAADPVRERPGTKWCKGEPRSGATDRGDPSAPRVVSRGVLRPSVGIAQGSARQSHPHADGAGLAGRAARRIRAAGSGRGRHGPRVLLSAEGSRPGALAVLRVPGGVRRGPRPDRPGRGRVRVAGGWLLRRVPA